MFAKAVALTLAIFLGFPALIGVASPSDTGAPASVECAPVQAAAANFSAEAEIRTILSVIDQPFLSGYVQTLQDFGTRYAYTPFCMDAAKYIEGEFIGCGLETSVQDMEYMGHRIRNVVGVLPGTGSAAGETVIVCAHYDSYSEMLYWSAPGADDDASGPAGVLAAARLLVGMQFNRTIKFIAFGGEELGLVGSDYYSELAWSSGESIAGVLNMDMISHNHDLHTIDVYTDDNSAALASRYHDIWDKYKDIIGDPEPAVINEPNAGWSDHAPFWQRGFQALCIIETDFSDHYHTTDDTIATINMTYMQGAFRNAVAAACEIAEMSAGDSTPPAVSAPSPAPDSAGNSTPVISVGFFDASGVNASSCKLYVNGYRVMCDLAPAPLGYTLSYWHDGGFQSGSTVRCKAMASDAGGHGAVFWWNFTVDTTPPLPPETANARFLAVEPDKADAVLTAGPGFEDSTGVASPSVLYAGGEFRLWYTGLQEGVFRRIMAASSCDGFSWQKQGVVLDVGTAGEPDYRGATDCSVILDGTYKMWYTGHDVDVTRVLYAESPDGVVWTKLGIAIANGTGREPDSWGASSPTVLARNGSYVMWYTGWDGVEWRVMRATSADGLTWVKDGVALSRGGFNDRDRMGASDPDVSIIDGEYVMRYTATEDMSVKSILEARSVDGISWMRTGAHIMPGMPWEADSKYVRASSAVVVDGIEYTFYTGKGDPYEEVIFIALREMQTLKNELVLEWCPSASSDVTGYSVRLAEDWAELQSGSGTVYRAPGTYLVLPYAGVANLSGAFAKITVWDVAGNSAETWYAIGKTSMMMEFEWELVSCPYAAEGTGIAQALDTLVWDYAMAYSGNPGDTWQTNHYLRADDLDDLKVIGPGMGLWLQAQTGQYLATCGIVQNMTIQLRTGWNLVSYPHPYDMTAAAVAAEIGPACQAIEAFDYALEYMTDVLEPYEAMAPGRGYWVKVSADTAWTAVNY
ncbi:MAG: M28 family peptidase [Methanobacteriota archaeon]